MTTIDILKSAKAARADMDSLKTQQKNAALITMADCIEENAEEILKANAEDIEKARGIISDVMLDRLRLNKERIQGMANGMRDVAKLDDPVGKVLERTERPNGIIIEKTAVPMGVVAIIYESRPNVTSDAAALCFKSGNVCVLRSGKEAAGSANAIINALRKGLEKENISKECISIIQDISRVGANELMTADGLVDLLVPRGGSGLIKACVENATVPCIQTGTGICHVYIDKYADIDKALKIVDNAKTSRPSVCNAEEVLVVHEDIAYEFLPKLQKMITDDRKKAGKVPVELRLDEKAAKIIDGTPAGEKDFDTEFLDYILAVKIVGSTEE
ncbi:MAG: glutamate-5-semialdehyde dehydrogenase, partial [Bacillota bacterium]|nr:glutamate-5-semialdehyde dehydrogenase [Bacillota bacterium]